MTSGPDHNIYTGSFSMDQARKRRAQELLLFELLGHACMGANVDASSVILKSESESEPSDAPDIKFQVALAVVSGTEIYVEGALNYHDLSLQGGLTVKIPAFGILGAELHMQRDNEPVDGTVFSISAGSRPLFSISIVADGSKVRLVLEINGTKDTLDILVKDDRDKPGFAKWNDPGVFFFEDKEMDAH